MIAYGIYILFWMIAQCHLVCCLGAVGASVIKLHEDSADEYYN